MVLVVPEFVPTSCSFFLVPKIALVLNRVPDYLELNCSRQVITNFSRAKTKVLEASFQLNNRHIFLVNGITDEITKYLQSLPSVETKTSTPACYLKSMQKDGPVLAVSCVVKSTVSSVIHRRYHPIVLPEFVCFDLNIYCLFISYVEYMQGGVVYHKIQQEILVHIAHLITEALGSDSPFTPLEPSSPTADGNKQLEPGLIM